MAVAEAAVAIVEARSPTPSILLIRRTEREGDSWSGHWSFPGGHCDREDSDALGTALRELEEECGIRLSRGDLAAALPMKLARRRVGRFLNVAPFHFRVERRLPTALAPLEAAEALWLAIDTLLDPNRHCLRPVPGLPEDLLYPAINLNGLPLWGFTYRLITAWLGIEPPNPHAGKEAAGRVLQFVIDAGLPLVSDWAPPPPGDTGVVAVARVGGPIPVELVRERFSAPGSHVPAVNRLQVRREFISLAGPEFEEYLILAEATPPSR